MFRQWESILYEEGSFFCQQNEKKISQRCTQEMAPKKKIILVQHTKDWMRREQNSWKLIMLAWQIGTLSQRNILILCSNKTKLHVNCKSWYCLIWVYAWNPTGFWKVNCQDILLSDEDWRGVALEETGFLRMIYFILIYCASSENITAVPQNT